MLFIYLGQGTDFADGEDGGTTGEGVFPLRVLRVRFRELLQRLPDNTFSVTAKPAPRRPGEGRFPLRDLRTRLVSDLQRLPGLGSCQSWAMPVAWRRPS